MFSIKIIKPKVIIWKYIKVDYMISIIDYGMGNIGSVSNAVKLLGYDIVVPKNKNDIKNSTHIILPGVGSFYNGMKNLKKMKLIDILNEEVLDKKKPFLGLCLGMQILADDGEEGGYAAGLGWISGSVKKFQIDETKFKIPHVGWNDIFPRTNSILFQNIQTPIFYFVHSYQFLVRDKTCISAECEYGTKFVAAVEKDNIFGLQFHTEKSQREGLKVLENFLQIKN